MDPFIGQISAFGFSFNPQNWAFCNGAQIAISQNNALYSLLGITYGGDGRVTFNLPDLRGRHPVGYGPGPGLMNYPIGTRVGAETLILTASQVPLPTHTHTAQFTPSGGGNAQVLVSTNPLASTGTPTDGSYLAAQRAVGGISLFTPATPAPTTTVTLGGVSGGGGGGTVTNDPAGSQATSQIDLRNPLLAINFCISLLGSYPSRN